MCERQTSKKYTSRPSPPYPANECAGEVMNGNDGQMYISSKVGAQRSYTWKFIEPFARQNTPSQRETEPTRVYQRRQPSPREAEPLQAPLRQVTLRQVPLRQVPLRQVPLRQVPLRQAPATVLQTPSMAEEKFAGDGNIHAKIIPLNILVAILSDVKNKRAQYNTLLKNALNKSGYSIYDFFYTATFIEDIVGKFIDVDFGSDGTRMFVEALLLHKPQLIKSVLFDRSAIDEIYDSLLDDQYVDFNSVGLFNDKELADNEIEQFLNR